MGLRVEEPAVLATAAEGVEEAAVQREVAGEEEETAAMEDPPIIAANYM